MNQKIIKRLASCAILFMVGSTAEARNGMVPSYLTQVPDTIPYGFFEDEREARDSSQFTRKNEARDKGARSAMEYVMDKRYINQGESFKKNWYDHLFFDAGYGFEQLSAPVSSYKFKPLSKSVLVWAISLISSIAHAYRLMADWDICMALTRYLRLSALMPTICIVCRRISMATILRVCSMYQQ